MKSRHPFSFFWLNCIWIFNDSFLNCSLSWSQKLSEQSWSGNLVLKRLVDCILCGGILHNSGMVHWDWNVHLIQLDSNWCERLNHLCFICTKSSCCILQINKSFLNDFINLIFCNPTKIFCSCNCKNLSIFLNLIIFSQWNKSSCFCVDTFNRLSSFSDNQSDQSCWDLNFHLIWTVCSSTCHFSLSFNDCIQLLSDSFYCIWVTFNENVSCLRTWGTSCSDLHLISARSLTDCLDSLSFFTNNQTNTFIRDL